jgi:hypothetical protein
VHLFFSKITAAGSRRDFVLCLRGVVLYAISQGVNPTPEGKCLSAFAVQNYAALSIFYR